MQVTDKEKKESVCILEIELEEGEKNALLKYGRSHIVNDEEYVINYAVNRLLKDHIIKQDDVLKK